MSCDYADGNRWRVALLVALGLFLLSRFVTLTAFPIFNDETIYLQYSQRIHEDWQKNKFISMNGEFTDWKPPLQYWLAAPFIEYGDDPLIVGRVIAVLASIAGFFGTYLFAKELFSQREGVIAAFLYVLCPPVLLHNDQFTAETFLFSTAPFFYWALLKAMRRKKGDWIWAVVAVPFATSLLLFKQSGLSLLAVSIFLPLARQPRNIGSNLLLAAAIIIGSVLAANAILPSEFKATREHFDRRWVMSISELAALPIATWRANLTIAADYIGATYSWIALLLFCVVTWSAVQRKNLAALAVALMCLAGGGGIILFLRGFNEYILNTAVVATLLPLLARLGIVLNDSMRRRETAWFRAAIGFSALLMLAHWTYQDILMNASAGKYIERSSRWARENYLETWSTGFGVKEILALLEKETRPGIVFADTQWGNPRTALEVYRLTRFPQLRIIPISREFLDPAAARKLADDARKLTPVRFAIFSADKSAGREQWIVNLEREICQGRSEIITYPGQMPIVVCPF
jgi:4-amino-4-deoxy-L-arabinose transferase-like glycosyltransferase